MRPQALELSGVKKKIREVGLGTALQTTHRRADKMSVIKINLGA